MKRILIVLLLCSWAHAASFNVTAVRINGSGTPPAALTGTGTNASGTLTASAGTFSAGEVGSGIIFNGIVCGITAFTSSTVVTISAPCTNATTQAWTVLTSACYNSVTKACSGWVAEIDISTVAAGGAYALGFSQANNNNPSAAKVVFAVTSNGFTNSGGATTYTRTCYGTKVLRQAYPTGTVNDDINTGGTFTTRIAVSCLPYDVPIFSSDTVTATIGAAFYTDGSANTNNSFSGAVTNNSTLAYSISRALFNWTYPGWQLITGSTITVRGTGGASSAVNNLPLACVVFTATDQHAHSVSQTVTVPTIDPTLGDKAPIIEYIANLPTASFSNHDLITVNFKAYPWIGDSTATMDSSDAVYSQPTPLYTSQFYLYDSTNAYTASAYVDGSATYPGSHTSGTFVAGEKLTQSTSSAIAYLIDVAGANGAGPIHIGQIVSGAPNSTNGSTWTGSTSGAVFTQTAGGTNAGSDANSCAVATSAYNSGSPPPACLTINGAAVKVAAYNNASATPTHNDVCGFIYLNAGYYSWTGASGVVPSTTGNCWATVTPNGALTQSQVVIDQTSGVENFSAGNVCTSGNTTCGTPIHVKNLTVNVATGPVSDFDQITYLWFDNVSFFDNGGTAPVYRDTIVYWTDSAIPSTVGGNGMGQFSNVNMAPALVRGNDLTTVIGVGSGSPLYTVVGNTNTAATNCSFTAEYPSATAPASVMPIMAFNTMYKCQANTLSTVISGITVAQTIGQFIVQNLIENVYTSEATPMFKLVPDATLITPANNVMLWHNTIAGGRMNRGYADGTGTGMQFQPVVRLGWSEIGNLIDELAIKTDTFAGTGPSGARDGNWYEVNGSGAHSDMYPDYSGGTTGWPSAGTFCMEFPGIGTYQPTVTSIGNSPANCNTNTAASNFVKFVNPLCFDGTSGNGGGGNYNLLSSSPATNFIFHNASPLPYDITGQLRNNSGYGSAGAFAQEKVLTPVFF